MGGKEVTITLVRKEEVFRQGGKKENVSFYDVVFPQIEVDERAMACYRLAEFAIHNGLNPQFGQDDIGYVRDLFLGTTFKRLCSFSSVPGEDTISFIFKELPEGDPRNDIKINLNTKKEDGTQFIIMD